MSGFSLHRIKLNDLASSALILLTLTAAIHFTYVLDRVDFLIFDIGQKIIKQAPPDDVIIVAIDQYSLSELGRWPWSRHVHAQLLQQLNREQPAAVGMDIIFSEPELQSANADTLLAQAIAQSQKVILPVLLESTRANGQIIETLPLSELIQHSADLGSVHAVLDTDSIARSVYLFEGVGTPTWQLFAQAVLNVAGRQPSQNRFGLTPDAGVNPFTLARKDQRMINFLGPPGHFPRISYAQVLKGEFPPGLFKDKIVFVGATALGMNDLLSTPVSGLGQPMAGVEFHANVLSAIRQQRLIQTIPVWLSAAIVMLIAVMPLLWIPKLPALPGFICTLVFLIVITLLSAIMPKFFGVWLPPAAALVALMIAYPIWSWRKLEAAQRFLDFELSYLRQNLITLPEQSAENALEHYDVFDTRIAQVRAASQQLRFLQNDRKETLAFISHDLRAPIVSAIMTLRQHPKVLPQLHYPLLQALHLAEGFLHASRAEMMDVAQFNEIDFVGLVHQAVDDAYEAALKKNIELSRGLVEGMVWILGNFSLLHRALLNLILNAVKYGPENSKVTIALTLDADKHGVLFTVTNDGAGIPKEEQSRLFRRFSRIEPNNEVAEGVGLGLYFVKTVVEKHGGVIEVHSDLNQPTTFQLRIPIVEFQLHSDD